MKLSNYKLLCAIAVLAVSGQLMADDAVVAPPSAPADSSLTAESKTQTYREALQQKYNLSPEQMKTLTDSKLPDSQLVKVAQLAKSSGKSISDILVMRNDQKMGWGKIAKTLGVQPGELGRANSELKQKNHGMRNEKHEAKRESKMKDHARKDSSNGKKDK